VPFLLMGPYYCRARLVAGIARSRSACDAWNMTDVPDRIPLEHGVHREIGRVCDATAQHLSAVETFSNRFSPASAVTTVRQSFGTGQLAGDIPHPPGYWCGGDDARSSFRQYLLRQYGSLDAINRRWRTAHASAE